MGVVRGLLKATRGATFSIGETLSLVYFTPGPSNELTEQADQG